MKFFLDTANLDELKKGVEWGIIDGVTTNPTLIVKEGRPIEEQIQRICDVVVGEISAGVVSTEAAAIIKEGQPRIAGKVGAPLRSRMHVVDAAAAGAHIGSRPFKVLNMLCNHRPTGKGLEQFLKHWNKVFAEAPVAG